MTENIKDTKPLEYHAVAKSMYGGFKPLAEETFANVELAAQFVSRYCSGKDHVRIQVTKEGMRDMEFVFLFQKPLNLYLIKINGKHIENKPKEELATTIQEYVDKLHKPMPKIVFYDAEGNKLEPEVASEPTKG